MFCIEVVTDIRSEVEEIAFEIDRYELNFGKRELCIVTDFQFGEYFGASDSVQAFQSHIFRMVNKNDSVKLKKYH